MAGDSKSAETNNVEGYSEDDINYVDTIGLSKRVKHYLKFNHINYERFARLLLGITQSRLSTLLNQPQPWDKLKDRVRAYYRRLQFWMDYKATFGNNPYMKPSPTTANKSKKKSSASKFCSEAKPRSLLDVQENKAYLDEFDINVDAMYANLHQSETEQSSAIASIQADGDTGESWNEDVIQDITIEDLRGSFAPQELMDIDKIIDQINDGKW